MSIMHNLDNATIHTLELGPMENLIYVIHDHATNHGAVIDPGWEAQEILATARNWGITLTDIILTHRHFDHVGAIAELIPQTKARLHLMKSEVDFEEQYPEITNLDQYAQQSDLHYDGEKIHIGQTQIAILHTPGHTPGSCCYLVAGHLFTGDTLFVMGCGRCDLPGGDFRAIRRSLHRLAQLPKTTVIHPGHNYDGISATLAKIRLTNPILSDIND